MVGGLGAHCRDDPGAPPRQGRGAGAEQLGGGLGRLGHRVLGRVCLAGAGARLARAVLDRRAAGVLDPLHPPPHQRPPSLSPNPAPPFPPPPPPPTPPPPPVPPPPPGGGGGGGGEKGNFLEIFSPQLLKTTI